MEGYRCQQNYNLHTEFIMGLGWVVGITWKRKKLGGKAFNLRDDFAVNVSPLSQSSFGGEFFLGSSSPSCNTSFM